MSIFHRTVQYAVITATLLRNVLYETGGIYPTSILEPFRYLHGNEANVFHVIFHYPLWDSKFPESFKLKATKENLLFVKA